MPTKCCWVIHRTEADQRTQSFPFPIVIHQSLDPAMLLERSSAKLLVLHALEHSTGSERVDALGRRAVEVIIVHDHSRFQRDIDYVTGVSLSLSLSLSLYYYYDNNYYYYCDW